MERVFPRFFDEEGEEDVDASGDHALKKGDAGEFPGEGQRGWWDVVVEPGDEGTCVEVRPPASESGGTSRPKECFNIGLRPALPFFGFSPNSRGPPGDSSATCGIWDEERTVQQL